MVYVLCSSGFGCDSSDHFIKLIKVGFTNNFEKRLQAYISSNPTIEILYEFENGTLEDEKAIHKFLSFFKYPAGNEWYYYGYFITNFFDTYTTIDSIRRAIYSEDGSIRSISDYLLTPTIDIYLNSILNVVYTRADRIKDLGLEINLRNEIDHLKHLSHVGIVMNWAKEKYPEKIEEINKHFEKSMCLPTDLNKEIIQFVRQYWKLPSSEEKLKFLCEYSPKSDDFITFIFDYIKEGYFGEFFEILGPEKCKQLGYDAEVLKNELISALK